VPDQVKTLSPDGVEIQPQSARMSKITNDGLTQFGTGYSCAHMATVSIKGLTFSALSQSHFG